MLFLECLKQTVVYLHLMEIQSKESHLRHPSQKLMSLTVRKNTSILIVFIQSVLLDAFVSDLLMSPS
jgi:hypothetical protein